MRRAARTDGNKAEIVQALRDAGATVYDLKQPCDLLVGFRGYTILVECKQPKTGRFTPAQLRFLETWSGGPVVTVTDVEGALRALGATK